MLIEAKLAYLEALASASKVEIFVKLDPSTRRIGISLTGLVASDGVLNHNFMTNVSGYKEGGEKRVPELLRPLFEGSTHEERVKALSHLATTPLLVSFEEPLPGVLTDAITWVS
jgi:hypothetical protein